MTHLSDNKAGYECVNVLLCCGWSVSRGVLLVPVVTPGSKEYQDGGGFNAKLEVLKRYVHKPVGDVTWVFIIQTAEKQPVIQLTQAIQLFLTGY